MAILIQSDGTETKVNPAHGGFTTDEMKLLIVCDKVYFTGLADGRWMAVADDFTSQAINEKASVLWQEGRPSAMAMRGSALVGTTREILGGKDGKAQGSTKANIRSDRGRRRKQVHRGQRNRGRL